MYIYTTAPGVHYFHLLLLIIVLSASGQPSLTKILLRVLFLLQGNNQRCLRVAGSDYLAGLTTPLIPELLSLADIFIFILYGVRCKAGMGDYLESDKDPLLP